MSKHEHMKRIGRTLPWAAGSALCAALTWETGTDAYKEYRAEEQTYRTAMQTIASLDERLMSGEFSLPSTKAEKEVARAARAAYREASEIASNHDERQTSIFLGNVPIVVIGGLGSVAFSSIATHAWRKEEFFADAPDDPRPTS